MHSERLTEPRPLASAPAVLPGDVRSETGTLRRVLVHRPGPEIDGLATADAAALLFDDAPDAERARAEHDELTATLRGAGVEVLYLADLLAGVGFDPAHPGTPTAAAGLDTCPPPNLMFVRDTSAWLGGELVLGALANPVRRRETELLAHAYAFHPAFANRPRGGRFTRVPGLEGGDLFCLSDRAVLIGVGQRTRADAAEALADVLFVAGFERVFAVAIPAERSSIHLDCLMTLVDTDLVLADRRLLEAPVVEVLSPGARVQSRIHLGLLPALAAALEVDAVRVVEVAGADEQWTLAANTLALGPGRVLAYHHNPRTNEELAAAGVEVLTVPGTELVRGHGGPRCLTCPLTRDAATAG
jgi:arginine deiminase